MDRSLDEIISERPQRGEGRDRDRAPPSGPRGGTRGPRGRGAPPPPPRHDRREEYPRDGVRKYRSDERPSMDNEWVHDRYEDDKYDRMHSRPVEDDRYGGGQGQEANGAKLRVENIHYDITEEDLRSLFARKGRLVSCRMIYDRSDRSTGTAWVVYADPRDARDAVEDFDGQNAQGQKIRVSIVPSGPAERGGGVSGAPSGPRGPVEKERSLFDRIQPRERSMFERIEGGAGAREDERDEYRGGEDRRRRDRSDSPRKNGRSLAVPENIDRYVPGRGSRSPIRRRGTPRESGRRPGARREESGRGGGGRRGGRGDAEGGAGAAGGRRPKKTAEELDAEMEDYFGKNREEESNGAAENASHATAPAVTGGDDDTDMIL